MTTLAATAPHRRVFGLDRLPAALLAGLVVLSLGPVLLVEIPAMVDYPNHLARMSILARYGTPDANPYYQVVWAPYPNLAMDLVVPPLARLVGVEAATRLFYVVGQLLVLGGAMALSFVVRRAILGAGVAACLALYSVPFAWGFVNFEFALGLALWCVAGWIALERRHPALRLALNAVAVAALVVSHLFALGIYGFTICILELWRGRAGRVRPLALVATFAGMAAPVALMVLAALACGGAVGGSRTEWAFAHKLTWLFSLNGYSREASMALTAVLVLLVYGAARSGTARFVGAGAWLAAGFALLYLAMPFRLFDTAFVDVRVVVAAALILPAFVEIRPAARWVAPVTAGTAAIAVANLAIVAWVQAEYRSEYRTLIRSFASLEPAAHVLIGHGGDAPDPPEQLSDYPMYHAPTLAAHYARAFVPTLFTYPGKQPITTIAAVKRIALPEGGPIPIALLAAVAEGRVSDPSLAFVQTWTRDFDYLYLLFPPAENPLPALLEPVSGGARFTLYRVRGARRLSTRP